MNNLEITYIANEGFLLTSSTHKILIDGLFSEGYGAFSVPPKEVTDKIMNSEAPFDNINLLLLTHYHKDHCDPVLINNYLSKYKGVRFITNKPAIVFIDGNCFGFIGKKKQFDTMTPELNQSISKTVTNVSVKALGLQHLSFYNKDSIDLEETMFNVSFLFEMDGINIFHSGDIEKSSLQEYLKHNKWTDPVDVAFLYYGLLKSGETDLKYILDILHPACIVVMHVPPGREEVWAAKTEQLRKVFPDILYFRNSLDSETITVEN